MIRAAEFRGEVLVLSASPQSYGVRVCLQGPLPAHGLSLWRQSDLLWQSDHELGSC